MGAHDVHLNLMDKDGWLTWMEAAGGKKRPLCHVDCCDDSVSGWSGSHRSSQEIFEELLEDPADVAVVVSDHIMQGKSVSSGWRSWDVSSALAVAILCDAAGLTPAGTKVICCTLEDRRFRENHYSGRDYEEIVYGHTYAKEAEVAKAALAAGARLVSAPDGWGPCEARIVDWVARPLMGVGRVLLKNGCGALNAAEIPVLAEPTEVVLGVAGRMTADALVDQRNEAVRQLREVFSALDAPMEQIVGTLSFGLIDAEEAKYRSFKIPLWKQELLRPSMPAGESDEGPARDPVAVSVGACARLWQAVFDKYLIEPVNVRKLSVPSEELDFEAILEGWEQVGVALGVEDALRAVCVDGVAIEDVLALM